MAKKIVGLFLNAQQLQAQIAAKYPPPTWVTLSEVRDSTGFSGHGREADMLAFGVWPSRGLQLIGFETKCYRGDWLRELANPQKAESIARYCDEWWLVTCDDVAVLEEIPAAWGWYIATEKGLQLMKAPRPEKPLELSRTFLMSIVRNIAKSYTPTVQVKEQAKAQADEIVRRRRDDNASRLEQLEQLEKHVRVFERASGINLTEAWRFPPQQLGEVVRLFTENNLPYQVRQLHEIAKEAGDVLGKIIEMPFLKPLVKEKK